MHEDHAIAVYIYIAYWQKLTTITNHGTLTSIYIYIYIYIYAPILPCQLA